MCVVSLGGMWACIDSLFAVGGPRCLLCQAVKDTDPALECPNPSILPSCIFHQVFNFSVSHFLLKYFLFCLGRPHGYREKDIHRKKERTKGRKRKNIFSLQTRDVLPYRDRKFSVSGDEWRDRGRAENRARRDGNGPVETMMS